MGARQVLILGLFLFLVVSEDVCHGARNCEQCMSQGPTCSWCFEDNFDDTRIGPGHRCATNETLIERGCSPDGIATTMSKLISQDSPASDDDSEGLKRQLKPQAINIESRPGAKLVTDFVFESIADYPVDLYFLVDLSYTMRDDLDTVSSLTKDIVKEMKTVTNNLRMGFGAFVDKPVYPFVMPSKSELENPCLNVQENNLKCDPTFLYKHILDITDDYNEFELATKNVRPSGNLDSPEGGLDALLQVAYCQDRVKWRKEARKIVVFATDGGFHLAGDGKLAGLIKPPPTTCQLTKQNDPVEINKEYWGWYTANETDYPSVGEVAHVLTEHAISVIFATTNQFEPLYTKLSEFLPNAGVGTLEDKSTNIVKLLRENYQKIANKAELSVSADPGIKVKVFTKCSNAADFAENSTCQEHPVGGKIEYKVEVVTEKCFEGKKAVKIRLLGLEDESVINVESACKCKACSEKTWPMKPQPYSARCQAQGYLQCGTCQCENGYTGDFCECSQETSGENMDNQCKAEGDEEVCSGRGRCMCGKCKCNQDRYYDEFCQCDRQGCKRASDNNQVCGGPERGECQCDGKCQCKDGYRGEACDCLASEQSCVPEGQDPNDPSVVKCSGQGICDCGQCFCKQGYTGQLCNEEHGHKSALCEDDNVKSCVTCLHEEDSNYNFEGDEDLGIINAKSDTSTTKPLPDKLNHADTPLAKSIITKCRARCNQTSIELDQVHITDEVKQNDGSNLCIIYTKDNCRLMYTYRYSDAVYMKRKLKLNLMKDKSCTNTTEILWIILGVILAIVLGGLLLLLIYKLVITIDDRKSYAQVVKEMENTRWEMTVNPTYDPPTTTVSNPTFVNQSY